MNYLALETSTEAFSVAVATAEKCYSFDTIAPKQHGDLLLPKINELLEQAGLTINDIDRIVYGKGPGAFTGVRIAVSAAQGLAFGCNCPLLGISSLQNLAAQALERSDAEYAWVVNDARMGEVYCALYQRSSAEPDWPRLVGKEAVLAPEVLCQLALEGESSWVTVGTGMAAYASELQPLSAWASAHISDVFPRADVAIALAKQPKAEALLHSAAAAVPTYLRNQVAKKSNQSSIIGVDRVE
ncbi:MAG: tRNA (adenosine(37)-N6)-threonylcarbamoyltransferase complex dimerization subunit type 1 TsaB [Gammaproteobacteria bacterium]|nr:tRNA (adenosine(37)-N6)-threonylcarbamoyltransferase complex dimerization subunit type 1 TsaB [Gammaproteobacteria bacterium]